jgi:tetratricopeptide (TPR) repeat protein
LAAAAAVVILLATTFFDFSWIFDDLAAGKKHKEAHIANAPAGGTPEDGGEPPVISDPEPPEVIPEPIAHDATDETRRIELRDGSTAIAQRGTRFTEVAPRQLKLEAGSLYLLVARDATPLEVVTPQGRALALGTRFLVSSEAADTRVAVAQGSVQLVRNNDAEQLVLARGEEGVLAPAGLTRRPAPRLSHLVSWARGSLREPERMEAGELLRHGLIVVDPDGQESRLSLREYSLDVFIENGVARTTIDQTFFNHHQSNTEGTFYFPLPPGAAVSRLAMYVNGVRNEGGMVERHRGQQIYNDIKYQNRDPALLEQLEGNLYKLRIFPLEGRQEKRIFLSFTQTVDELYRTLGYWFPMDHTHDNAGVLRIKVRVKHGEELYDVESSTHKFTKTIEDGDLVLSYEAANTKPDRDLLLKLIPKFAQTDLAETAVLKRDGRSYLHTRIRPELKGHVDPQPRQWFVLNDTSASRSAADLEAQAHIIERILAEADDQDRIAIANLNIDARHLMGGPVPLDDDAAQQAVEEARAARRIGGTNLEAGIASMRDWIANSGATNPHIVYLGDGLATDGSVTRRELTAHLDREIPFLGIAVGKKVDLSWLRDAANATGGGAYLMNPDEDLNWRVFDMLAALNTPRLTELSWEFPGTPEGLVAYADRGTLAAGEALTIVAATEAKLPSQITIRGKLAGAPWEEVVALDPAREGATFIPRFWAQRHVEELLKEGEKHREEVVRLSKKHYVATPFTSLIVLENDKMYQDYKVEKGRSDHWAAYPAPDKIPVVREPLPWLARSWTPTPAGQLVDDSKILTDPKTAEEILDTLLPPPSGQVVDRSAPATDRVRRHLYRGEGYYNLGKFDDALMEFEAVLRIDPYNSAARRWMERVSSARSSYYRAAYDETRARLLMEVDAAWERAVPPVPIPVIPSETVTGGWIDSGNGGGGAFRRRGDWEWGFRPAVDAATRNSIDAITMPVRGVRLGADFVPPRVPLSLPIPPPKAFAVQELQGYFGSGEGGHWNPLWGEAAIPVGREVAGRKYRGRFSYHQSHYSFVGSLPATIAALGNSSSDRASAVEMALGREKRGSITDAAAALVRAAEAKRQPVRLGDTIVTPDGRMKSRGSSPMYLEEEIISDGRKWFHIFRELGFATCRPVTPSNLAVVQSVVPHWPPSLQELEARWIVTLVGQDDDSFEIVLDDPDKPSRKTVLKISKDGRLLESRAWRDDKLVATRSFRYEGNSVVVTGDAGVSRRYEAVEIEVAEALFGADLDEMVVVVDLPLRKPAFYEKQLAAAETDTYAVKKQLLRHFIIAKLLDNRLVAPPVPVKGSAQKPLDAKSAWTRLIQLGGGSTPVFDHRTLAAAVDISSAVPEGSDFLAHFKDASTLSQSGSPTLEQVKDFIADWPDSPYVLSVVQRCGDRRAWVALLDLPHYRSLAIDRIALDAEVQSWPDRSVLAPRIADFLVAAAEEGRPAVVIPPVARFLGREQQDNASWRKVVAAYREAAGDLAALDTRSVGAILDLAIKERDGALEKRCLDLLLQTMVKPREIAILANMFSHHGRHEQAVAFYKKALAAIGDPDAGLLEQAAQSARQVDEKLSITWQHRALKTLGESNGATNKQLLAQHYTELLARALAAKELGTAMELALEGYELLPGQHALVTKLATYFHERGQDTERWRWLSTIVDRHPKNAEASGAIGGWYDHQDLLAKADAMFADAHSFDSAHPQWLVRRASTLYRLGKFEEADAIYRELIKTPWAHQLKSQVPAIFRLCLSDPGKIGLLTTGDPGAGWADPDYDDRDWENRTTRFTSNHSKSPLWDAPFHTRQKFRLARIPRRVDLQAGLHGAECEVYLNGTLVQRLQQMGTNTNGSDKAYSITLPKEKLESLRVGENVLAVRYKKVGRNPRAYVELMQLFTPPK